MAKPFLEAVPLPKTYDWLPGARRCLSLAVLA